MPLVNASTLIGIVYTFTKKQPLTKLHSQPHAIEGKINNKDATAKQTVIIKRYFFMFLYK
jgi:hypothetical protein